MKQKNEQHTTIPGKHRIGFCSSPDTGILSQNRNKTCLIFLFSLFVFITACNNQVTDEELEIRPTPEPEIHFNYYVSVNGNDENPGTHSNPFRTIQKAVNLLQAGESVAIMEGKYEEKVTIKNSGTPGRFITISAYPEAKVVIDGHNIRLENSWQALIRLEDAHYIKIKELHIENSNHCGIFGKDGSSNIAIEGCSIRNCVAPAICFGSDYVGSSHIKVLNNYVNNCAQLDREAISLRTVNNFEIAHNTIENVIKENIDVKSGCKNGTIHHNHIINPITSPAIYLDAGYADKPANDGQYNIHVFRNIIENPKQSGIVIASERGNTARDIHIYNNLVFDLKKEMGFGIHIADNTDPDSETRGRLEDIYIYNNTIYGRAQYGIYINIPTIKNIIIRNNIVADNAIQIKLKENIGIDKNQVLIENNLLYGTIQPGESGVNTIIGNPQFSGQKKGDFTLQATSPAIDKGLGDGAPDTDIIGTKRPLGKGYDIGAYEFIF